MTTSFDRLVWFGDSLTDSDEFYALSLAVTGGAIPPDPPYAEQFSNGPVHADIVPGLLGVESGEGLNYAVGSARAVGSRTAEALFAPLPVPPGLQDFDINLGAQVDRFLADAAGTDLSSTAAVVLIGSNDLNNFTPATPFPELELAALVAQILGSIGAETQALLAAGTGTVFLTTLPDPGFFPAFAFVPEDLQALAPQVFEALNGGLQTVVDGFRLAGQDVRLLDLEALTDEIEADPGSFGFATIEQPLLLSLPNDPVPVFNPAVADVDVENLGFVDVLHPTTEMHEVFAVYEAAAMAGTLWVGDGGADVVVDGRGGLTALASGGDDRLALGRARDTGLGGQGDDTVAGAQGADVLSGGSGDDRVSGGRAADVVAGNAGADLLCGGRGGDLILDGAGDDVARGGNGADVFVWGGAGDAGDVFDGGRGRDTLILDLTGAARAEAEAAIAAGGDTIVFAGLTAERIEEVLFAEDGALDDLAALTNARIGDADLWGFV